MELGVTLGLLNGTGAAKPKSQTCGTCDLTAIFYRERASSARGTFAPPSRFPAMVDGLSKNADELRRMAREMRQLARNAELPGYAEKMIRAAESLEVRATELDGRVSARQ